MFMEEEELQTNDCTSPNLVVVEEIRWQNVQGKLTAWVVKETVKDLKEAPKKRQIETLEADQDQCLVEEKGGGN